MQIKLDNTTTVSYPTMAVWAAYYAKFHDSLLGLAGRHSANSADAEDAVEEAFDKLMHRKDPAAYGGKMPTTESGWFWALYWQVRSFLSHLKDRADVHAKYVERFAQELEDAFAPWHQGEALDSDLHSRALVRALETLKAEQDISRRDLEIYIARTKDGIPAKAVAEKHGIKPGHVDVINHRVKLLLQEHGLRHFEAALRHETRYGLVA